MQQTANAETGRASAPRKTEPRYTLLRALAIIMVVYNHCSGDFNSAVPVSQFQEWGQHIQQLIFTAVPLFVMLSGALLLGKKEEPSVFFSKRLKRILIPFLLWSSIVFVLLRLKAHEPLTLSSIGDLVFAILTKGVFGVYWYIYLIIALYLLTPFLRVIVQNMSLRMVALFSALPFCWHFVGGFWPDVKLIYGWHFPYAVYLFYFLAGYILHQLILRRKHGSICKYGSILLSLVAIAVYAYFGYDARHWAELPASIGIFILILQLPQAMAEKAATKVNYLSKTSYGIYLSHCILGNAIISAGVFHFCPIWGRGLCVTATVLILNMLMFFILEKCRLAKWFM